MSGKDACATCGYQWTKGQSGYHICSTLLLKKIEELETTEDKKIEELKQYNTKMTDLADEAIYQLKGYIQQIYGPNLSESDFKKWEYFWHKFCDIRYETKGK